MMLRVQATLLLPLFYFVAGVHGLSSSSTTSSATTTTTDTASSTKHLLWGTDACDTVACRFKAPNPQTPKDIAVQWEQQDKELWQYVNEHVPAVLDHTGSAAFDEHLKGVQAVLRYWGAPTHLTHAGLFHSIYGTEGFQGFALPLSERPAIQTLIGSKAEKLCFVFCMVDRSTLDKTVLELNTTSSTTTS